MFLISLCENLNDCITFKSTVEWNWRIKRTFFSFKSYFILFTHSADEIPGYLEGWGGEEDEREV